MPSKKVKGKGFMQNKFDWGVYPDAEVFLDSHVEAFLTKNSFSRKLSVRMEKETSTRFFDWIDHIVIPKATVGEEEVSKLGFKEKNAEAPKGTKVFVNSDTIFFPVLLGDSFEVALKPERLENFIEVMGDRQKIEGKPFSLFRKAVINEENGCVLSAVERRGYDGYVVKDTGDIEDYREVMKAFISRNRSYETDREGMDETKKLIQESQKKISSARVADAFFRAERKYWENRNKAGQIQRKRQDVLGLGWGNHDHHTYRSSRRNFKSLIDIFETMGYVCREQFHAGEQAGWGAQIVEHPVCNIVVFSDVDLTVEEVKKDFAHADLESQKDLGTVGLWVGLHGESILQAGMHHLEARFQFEKLKEDLNDMKINTLPAFSNFSFLKQAFTQADKWPVDKKRLDILVKKGSITHEQYERFVKEGARGSHLENLQRREGFKGFNQDSVSAIIKATDPRISKAKGSKEEKFA